jgi:NhaP-type Na+/H+ or K+/H+ antiporter
MQLEESLAALGGMLVFGALISGIARRSFLSLTAVFVLAGFALGEGGLEVLQFDPRGGFVQAVAVIALILILFRDGLTVEAEMLQTAWHLPFRKLVLAMPITGGIVAVATHLVTDLGWTESFLVGALLSPTDPVLSSSVVMNPRVPRKVRHSLNLESGLNDGLALPPVLALTAALAVDPEDFEWLEFVLQDVVVGLVFGLAVGFVGSRLLPRATPLGTEISSHQKSLYALGVAFCAYAAAVLPPEGNGFIAVFVAAIVLGIRRPDIRECFEAQAEDVVELVKLGVFLVFGSLLTIDGLFDDGLAAVAIVVVALLVARPIAVFVALTRTDVDVSIKAFMAWFGPRGVATMTFALFVLAEGVPQGDRIFNIAALTVLVSIVAHSLTELPGVAWLERRSTSPPEPRPPTGPTPGQAPAS